MFDQDELCCERVQACITIPMVVRYHTDGNALNEKLRNCTPALLAPLGLLLPPSPGPLGRTPLGLCLSLSLMTCFCSCTPSLQLPLGLCLPVAPLPLGLLRHSTRRSTALGLQVFLKKSWKAILTFFKNITKMHSNKGAPLGLSHSTQNHRDGNALPSRW